jgi:hypothetical protein
MVTQVKSLDFLPEVFRTTTNRQFLAATLDQLIQQPDLRKVEGYIGTKYGYAVERKDQYVLEPTASRENYQLDPSVVLLKPNTQTARDFISYPGMTSALKNQGGLTDNNNRLFENQFYSWQSFINQDMIVNYSQYYWIPDGPDSVAVSTDNVYLREDYVVTDNINGFDIAGITQANPTLTLLRGGTYTFAVNQNSAFWIQGFPGLSGYAPGQNESTRDILGVTNNGINNGTVTFTVPAKDAQSQYDLPGNYLVDVVSTLQYNQINGQVVANIDGVTQLNGKTLMFYNNGDSSTQINYYTISVNSGTGIVTLSVGAGIVNDQKITATSGTNYVGKTFYRDSTGVVQLIPYQSAVLDTLYYQDGTQVDSVGIINLIESNSTNVINITDIIGKKTYTSPNGVTFINGLKVFFEGNIFPASYENNEYYVSGVGSAIELLPVNEYYSVESGPSGFYHLWSDNPWDSTSWDQSIYIPINPDYITIDRNSRDRNAWSRGNRWFNIQVINATRQYNGEVTTNSSNTVTRAQRPIIQFDGNLGLFDSGTKSLGFVSLFDNTTTNAFAQVVGKSTYTVDGVLLNPGQTIIFNRDTNPEVRRTVYTVEFAPTGPGGSNVITLTPTPRTKLLTSTDNQSSSDDTIATNNDQVCVLFGNAFSSTTWRYQNTNLDETLDTYWVESQRKTQINQAPLFDIYDSNGFSLSNSDYYPGTTFSGTKLFSYTPGTGANDTVLGFPISYSSAASIGDIEFTVNLNSDTFNYQQGSTAITSNINIGYVYYYPVIDVATEQLGWITAEDNSVQPQVFAFTVLTNNTLLFICDVPANTDTIWKNIVVYYNSVILNPSQYTVTIDGVDNTTTINLLIPTIVKDKITVLIISDVVSKTGYYQIPSNLQNNPFNTNVTIVTVGDIKNQYSTIFNNAPGVTGTTFGPNNIYNLGDLEQYGTAIIQSSASLATMGIFLKNSELNLFEALQYNSEQYINYKTNLLNLTNQNDFSIYTTPAQMLDTIIYQITTVKNDTNSFFWSDMLSSGSPYVTNTYPLSFPISTITLPLSRTYDFNSSNYYGVSVYVTTVIDGQSQQVQLIRGNNFETVGIEYVVSDMSPSLVINYNFVDGDIITVYEYNQTYGSYCPNTPTKLGMYPKFLPAVILDDTYTNPTYFIRGHDGSYNRLYGTYTNGVLSDFRDKVLLEFEQRVYNNLKVHSEIPLPADEVIPGQSRTTEYTYEEIVEIYSTNFLKWVGANRIDYKTQQYNKNNQFSYNYNQSTNILDSELLQQGYWRGIYNWFYDTSDPANSPWEMLGLNDEPTWWTDRYGPAPYTSDNTYMWQEISEGYVWNNGESYINPAKVRPQLLSVLPVNAQGTLISPLVNIVENYDALTFDRSWRVGDQAPAETSYLRSSSYPFDLMKVLALTKPAKFYNLFVDRDLYKYDAAFDQYLYRERYHFSPIVLANENEVYGNGVSKASYINWVVDYINQRGVNGHDLVDSALTNVDVRLTYNLAGFSAKNYLQFLIEKSTPNSQNPNLLIPANSYDLLLYNNVPSDKISYSSVIVQKTENGWTVWGNSQGSPYFTAAIPKGGTKEIITVNEQSVSVSAEFYDEKTVSIPYGQVFYSVQGLCEFIKSYGQRLINQGMIFDFNENNKTYDWNQMISQLIWWTQQYWEIGSTINLNPSAKLAQVDRENLIVQPLTIQDQNFMLNQDLIPLQSQNVAIIRENQLFNAAVLSDGDTIAYTNFNLSSIESAVVFNNYTEFNDTIYDLVTGLRQNRLIFQGYKSADWRGYMNAAGFIISYDDIKDWTSNTKYASGEIVKYKGQYWTADQLIQPNDNFAQEQWIPTSYDKLQFGLLANPSTMAYESLYYYDTVQPNFAEDQDLASYSLIGFRPRQYLTDIDLSLTTQVNVYQTMIQEKGTNLIANAFKKAQLLQGQIDYDIKENWAIKNRTFGSVSNSNFVEALLNQNLLTGNPSVLAFTTGTSVTGADQNININDSLELINWEDKPMSANFLPLYDNSYNDERGLPSAGYVNLNDVKFTTYTLDGLNQNTATIDSIYRSNIIWVASHRGTWNVFTPQALGVPVVSVINNLDGTIQLNFESAHGLKQYDTIVLFQMDARVNAYYEIGQIVSSVSVTVVKNLDPGVLKIVGTGLVFKLVSRRFQQASDQVYTTVPYSEFYSKKSWVDEDANNNWSVWQCAPTYAENNFATPTGASVTNLGTSVAYSTLIGYIASNSSAGSWYRTYTDVDGLPATQTYTVANSTLGTEVIIAGEYVYASDTLNGAVYAYRYNSFTNYVDELQVISQANTGALAASLDGQWLYIANTTNRTIAVWALNSGSGQYEYVNAIVGPAQADGFGTSISTGIDGNKLIVGAPFEGLTGFDNCGSVYVYSRSVEYFQSQGESVFTVSQTIPNNIADVYVNDVLTTTGVVTTQSGSVIFNTPTQFGSTIAVSYGQFTLVQQMYSADPRVGGNFGLSVSTNRYGGEIVIGAPYDVVTANKIPGVQGAVYRWTNSGQEYGSVIGRVVGSQTGTVFIDGYKVNFSGTATQIANQINVLTPANIKASATGEILVIGVITDTSITINDIIDVVGTQSVLSSLGITPYTNTQMITNPNLVRYGEFGYRVALGNDDSLIVSDPQAVEQSETTFDYSYTDQTISSDLNSTFFDQGATTFVDLFPNRGVVFQFNYLPAASESIVNPGKFVFGQYIQTLDRTGAALSTKFGLSLANNDGVYMVGCPDWYADGNGRVYYFNSSTGNSSWSIDKQPQQIVDINNINNISIYDVESNQTLSNLDYIDPVQGKLLGAAETNLDFVRSTDPAIYNVGLVWAAQYVGKMWLDTTNLRMLNYHQPSLQYNSKRWGQAFPGSLADVYTWTASSFPPIKYNGTGIVVDFNKYNTSIVLDRSTNSMVTLYYFWVKNSNIVPPGKTLSPQTISQYVLNPLSSGIPFLAPLTTNAVAIYNNQANIQSNSSALHIGYSIGTSADQKHTQWNLIQSTSEDSFLPGLPTPLSTEPSSLYSKYLDSFAGQNRQGYFIPPTEYPALVKYGTGYYQSMFVDRKLALQNYIQYANEILSKFPIVETRSLEFIQTTGIGYDTSVFWKYVDWWAPGYGANTKIVLEVEYYSDLQKILPNKIINGTETIVTGLQNGLIVKVTGTSSGNYEVYAYNETTGWTRVGLQNGTVELLTTIYTDPVGWDSTAYDTTVFDKTLSDETWWIIRWLNEQVYIDDLQIERNNSLMLMFALIQSEALEQQNYLPWLTKTSLIDVTHRVRDLLPYKKFQADNQEFLSGYLNEIKPFHVKINSFLYTYDGLDTFLGDVTDFDLPPQYNDTYGDFQSPQLVYSELYLENNEYLPTSDVWSESQYSQWFQNYGLSIDNEQNQFSYDEERWTLLSQLTKYITKTDTIIPVKSVSSFPESGTAMIGAEQIAYSGIDRINNLLTGVTRGYENTVITVHYPNANVNSILPPIIVLNEGRGYTEPPVITISIDAPFPAPRTPAVLSSSLAGDRLLSVTVVNPGSGYAAQPVINITSSPISSTFSSGDVNTTFNTITVTGHQFETGDSVRYTVSSGTTPPTGLTENEYYYVRVIDPVTVALYRTFKAAFDYDKVALLDSSRVHLIDSGSGPNNTLAVTARAAFLTTSQPTREITTTIKFDRISYGSKITQWATDQFYAGRFEDIGKLSSSTLLTDSSSPWEYLKWNSTKYDADILASAEGAIMPIISVQVPTGGVTNTILNIDYGLTTVAPGQLNGQKIVMFTVDWTYLASWSNNWSTYGWSAGRPRIPAAWTNPTEYYVRVTGVNTVQLYSDPLFNYPVDYADFSYLPEDIVFLPEPFIFQQSLVTYAGKLYQCVVSNNDAVFNYDNWVQIFSDDTMLNAADRIAAFYEPTVNMTGRDIRQLMSGVEYPNATIQGDDFSFNKEGFDIGGYDTDFYNQNIDVELDAIVRSPDFTTDPLTNPTVYDIEGGQFGDGYGPEELVPGLVSDLLEFNVTTDTATLPPGEFLNFRIQVNQYGDGTVWNTNPFTQTFLTQDFVSTGSIADVIYVDDASKLVSTTTVSKMTDSNGEVIVSGIPWSEVSTPISINLPNAFTVDPIPGKAIKITISGITTPTPVNITISIGNMLILDSEYIQFTSINLVNNYVTGLLRGRKKSITNTFVANGTTVQSVLTRDKLLQKNYYKWWYDVAGWDGTLWDNGVWDQIFAAQTLEESSTEAAIFLQRQTP